MKFTLSWLKDFLDTNASLDEISTTLTAIGLEVEEIIDRSELLAPFTIAEITDATPHPDADRLQVCSVNTGSETLQIVCGAPNARKGIKVCLAPIGTYIPAHDFTIKKSKIRGVESCGMMCSAAELDLGGESDGIMELPQDAPVGAPFASTLGYDDPMIEIAITPNRGDCLGVYGIARDLAAAGLGTLRQPEIMPTEGSFDSTIKTNIDAPELSSFFSGRFIKNVKNGPSPAWLQQRLNAIGKKSISTLVDITNYMVFTFGRPCHVFDADKLNGSLTMRSAKDGEKITGLDEEEHTLEQGMCVVADGNGPVAIAGVLGGLETGCQMNTTNVFLEIAQFDAIAIAMTGRKLQIDSDARYRYERHVDADFVSQAMDLTTQMILDLCGGEASHVEFTGTPAVETPKVSVTLEKITSRLGIDISLEQAKSILEQLYFTVSTNGSTLEATVPSFRPDVRIADDLVEEIARIFGYDNIPTAPMPAPLHNTTTITPSQRRLFDLKRLLAARGLTEAITYSFTKAEDLAYFGNQKPAVLANPISSELSVMRSNVLPNLLQAIKRNQARGAKAVSLFEAGPQFDGPLPGEQQNVIAGVRAGVSKPQTPHSSQTNFDVFNTKADVLAVLSHIVDTSRMQVQRNAPNYYHPGRSGSLGLGKNILAYFGEIHPRIAQAFGLDGPVVAFEVFLANAPEAKAKRSAAKKLYAPSNLQKVERDFAFLMNQNVEAQTIVGAVRKAEKKLLDDVQIFDIYEGEYVEAGKKSVALKVTLQPANDTLTDEQIQTISNAIVVEVEKATGGSLRDGK